MNTPSFRLIIFDLDGTLIDSRVDVANAANAARAAVGLASLPRKRSRDTSETA